MDKGTPGSATSRGRRRRRRHKRQEEAAGDAPDATPAATTAAATTPASNGVQVTKATTGTTSAKSQRKAARARRSSVSSNGSARARDAGTEASTTPSAAAAADATSDSEGDSGPSGDNAVSTERSIDGGSDNGAGSSNEAGSGESDGDSDGDGDQAGTGDDSGDESGGESGGNTGDGGDDDEDDGGDGEAGAGFKDVSGKVLTKEALEKFRNAEKRKGVVYLSRVPPFMKPAKVRHLLSQYGDIGRLYLVPEDASVQRRRRKLGKKTKKIYYTEGWVEFMNKRHAKRCAEMLNNRKVGGKRHNFHYEDLWNIKYLHKFKWPQLTQKIAYERRIQAQRLKAELAQAKREAAFYVSRAEAAKSIAAQERRKLAVAAESRSGGGAGASAAQDMVAKVKAERRKVRRRFHQVAPVADSASKVLSSPLLQKMMGGTASGKKRKRTGAGAAAGTKHARKASQ